MVTVYAVASAKGGVGKTTTTAALATILAESGADVVAVDADIGMANLAGVLGIDIGETTVHDVLAGRADPFDALHDGPAGLRVVPGETDLDAYAEADPSGIRDVVAAFDGVDYVFVDAGAGLSHDSSLPLALADETLLVSTSERGALGDTEKTRQLTERLGGSVAGAALTRVDPADPESDLVEELLDAPILGRIPEDDAISRAGRAGEPLATFAPTAPATVAYRELARKLTGASIADPAEPEGEEDATGAGGGAVDDDAEPATGDDTATPDDDTATPDDDTATSDAATEPVSDDTRVGGTEPDEPVADVAEAADDTAHSAEDTLDAADEDTLDAADEDTLDAADEDTLDAADEDTLDAADEDTLDAADEDTRDATDETERDDIIVADGDATADADAAADAAGGSDALGESDAGGEAEPGGDVDAGDDELAGSIPFRDDDSRTRETVLTGEADGEDDADAVDGNGPGGSDGASGGDETDANDGANGGDGTTDEDEAETKGGFFSRLFGR